MTQYVNEYGTTYAVQEYKGEPRIMCRAKDGGDWLVSGTLAVVAAAAKTIVDVQDVLDNHARTHGWRPVEAPSSAEPPEIVDEGSGPEDGCPYLQPLENSRKYTCQCSICNEKFVSKGTCNKSYRTCGWYLDKQEKNAAPPVADDGFPDWVQPMAAEFLQFDFVRALPAFTATELKNSDPVQHYQGGSIADHRLYDTDPKGIKFTVLLSNRYLEKYYTWPDFVRRCKAAGLAPEPLHQDKEDAPCNTEPPAQTGAAAATTAASAAPMPSTAAETTTTSASGAGANSCGTPAPAAQPNKEPPAELAPTAPTNLPAFDYSGLDAQTVQDLHLAEREFASGRRMAEIGLRRMADGVAIAHDALCGTDATLCRNGDGTFTAPEKTFGRWCESVGLNRKAAERLLNVSRLFDQSSPKEEKVLETLGPTLLYAAAKPSAPPELVQAVKDGDITTHKQYQDLLARYNAERAAREKAEKDNDFLRADSAKARDAAHTYHRQYDEVAAQRNALIDQQGENIRLRIAAEKERDEAVKQRDGTRDENASLKAQIRDLESRPVEVAVAQPGEDQIEAWRKEGEARAAAALRESIRKADQAKADAQRQVDALQNQLAAARPDADACQRTVDTLYETTENLRLLLRTQLRQAQLPPTTYGTVVAHVLQAADALRDTVRSCAPAGYTMDDEEDDFL